MNTNPITDSLKSRKSVRAFEDRQIPEDIKQEILRCAAQAPTAGNQQLYTILDITDQALKEKLAVTCEPTRWMSTRKPEASGDPRRRGSRQAPSSVPPPLSTSRNE